MIEFNQRIIAPSLLASDYTRVGEEARRALDAGADWLHCDIMDGHFVDNISFGPEFVAAVHRAVPEAYLDVHLMLTRPDHYFPRFVDAGAGGITVHVEADHEVGETLGKIREAGCRPGLTLNPATPFEEVEPYLGEIDLLLVMTVVPGFGGQSFMEKETMPKVEAACATRRARDLSFHIEVDGGIDAETVHRAAAHGANAMVAGTALFKAPDMAAAIAGMRRRVAPEVTSDE